MRTLQLLLLIKVISLNSVYGQILKSDTTIFSDTSKLIVTSEQNRILNTMIIGQDTSVMVDNSLYYENFMDSIMKTKDYLDRRIIDDEIKILWIHFSHAIGCYGVAYSHMFFYFNKNLNCTPKGVFFFNDPSRREKVFSYLSATILDTIVDILNQNMALNISDSGYELLSDIRTYYTGRNDYNVEVNVVFENDTISNIFNVYSTNFGFGNNVVNLLMGLKHQMKHLDDTIYSEFIDSNTKFIQTNKELRNIIELYLTNDNRKLSY